MKRPRRRGLFPSVSDRDLYAYLIMFSFLALLAEIVPVFLKHIFERLFP